MSLSRALLEVAASERRALADTHFDAADATMTRSPRGVEVLVRPSGGAAMFLFAFERLASTPEVGARCVVGWSAAKGDATPPTAYVATARSICASLRAW